MKGVEFAKFLHNKERKSATTIAVAIVGRAITVWGAIQKKNHEPNQSTKLIQKLKQRD